MIFKDGDHAIRFKYAIQTAGAVRDDGTIKGDFGASLYILTGLPSVYDRVEKHIHHSYIDFEPMFHMGLSSGETVLVALAGNLYNGGFFGGYTPQDIVSYSDEDGVLLASTAMLLRKKRLDLDTVFSE